MKRKILLVSTTFEDVSIITAGKTNKAGIQLSEYSPYPLGLIYLQAYLESKGHEVRVLNLYQKMMDVCYNTVVKTIKEFQPDMVGFQVLTMNRVATYKLLDYLEEHHPDIHIVMGGMHATLMANQLVTRNKSSVCVLGEGEITLGELVEAMPYQPEDLDKVAGIVYYHPTRGPVTTKHRKDIADLDVLPFPDPRMFFDIDRTNASIITSRGCPFKCSFCCLDAVSQRLVRQRSVNNVVDEIEWLLKRHPQVQLINLQDDTFTLNNKWGIKFCDEIIRRGIKVKFLASARAKPMCDELAQKMEQAGFVNVLFGLESGAEEVLDECEKKIKLDDVVNAFEIFGRTKIDPYAFLIIGLENETWATIKKTTKFIKRLQRIAYIKYSDDIAIANIYPGTKLLDIAKAKGLITDDFWLGGDPVPAFTVEHSLPELIKMKEYLLDHIMLDRHFTLLGYLRQRDMVPYVKKVLGEAEYKRRMHEALMSPFRKFSLFDYVASRLRHIYRLGTSLSFRNMGGDKITATGMRYAGKGWSYAEEWGTWTEGREAELKFFVTRPVLKPLRVTAAIRSLAQQRVDIEVNGELVSSSIVTEQQETLSFDIKSKLYAPGFVNIVVRSPDARSPREMGLGSDSRVVGLGFKDLVIAPVSSSGRGIDWRSIILRALGLDAPNRPAWVNSSIQAGRRYLSPSMRTSMKS